MKSKLLIILFIGTFTVNAQDFSYKENIKGYVLKYFIRVSDSIYLDSLYWGDYTFLIDSLNSNKYILAGFHRDCIDFNFKCMSDSINKKWVYFNYGKMEDVKNEYVYSLKSDNIYYLGNTDTIVIAYFFIGNIVTMQKINDFDKYIFPESCPIKQHKYSLEYYSPIQAKELRSLNSFERKRFGLLKRTENYFYPNYCN